MQNSPQPVQEPSSSSSWSSQIRFDAQEARIKGLEANLEAERSLHLQDSEDLRKSNETLRGALMRAEAALRAREDDLAKSKAMLVQFEIELGSLRKSEADWRTLAQGLKTELELFKSQMRQDEASVNQGLRERERNVVAVKQRCKDAMYDNAVKDRQVLLMLNEVENAERRAFIACEQSSTIAKEAEEKRRREVAMRDAEVESLRGLLRDSEVNLDDMKKRFEVLQAWCFRVWWSVEGIFAKERNKGGVLEATHPPPSRRNTVLGVGGRGVRKEFKYPQDWRTALQMQFAATGFWAQEVFKARIEKRDEDLKNVEELMKKVASEVENDQARRESLQQSWLKVERTVWQREKESMQERAAQLTDLLKQRGFHSAPPHSMDMEELYSWAASQAQAIQTELEQIKPIARLAPIQKVIAELSRPTGNDQDEPSSLTESSPLQGQEQQASKGRRARTASD